VVDFEEVGDRGAKYLCILLSVYVC
jgi:hypothetical protein